MAFTSKIPQASIRYLSRSIAGGGGKMRIAVFRNGDYHAGLERTIREEGFFAVAIKDPEPSDIEGHPDFLLAPEWIRWVMPTPANSDSWIASLKSSNERNNLRRKLKEFEMQGDEVRSELAPLTMNDYELWYENLYLPEIGGKTGAVLHWPRPEAVSRKMKVTPAGAVAGFLRIFMYHRDGSFIGGILLSVSHAESCLTTRAAAFERRARAKYDLAIHGMHQSIIFTNTRGLKWTSYGTDPNLYGVDVTVGLQRFKAGIGMKPVLPRVGTSHLIKILDKNLDQIGAADNEKPSVLLFAIEGSSLPDRISLHQRLPTRQQRGDLDLLWGRDHGLKPVRFVSGAETPPVNVPKGMVLQDIFPDGSRSS